MQAARRRYRYAQVHLALAEATLLPLSALRAGGGPGGTVLGPDVAARSFTGSASPYAVTAVLGGADYTGPVRFASGQPWFDVTHPSFAGGAKGDGKADDTAAIQAAITAANTAGGGVVFFPQGSYRITTSLTLVPQVILQGIGRGSILKPTAAVGANGALQFLAGEISTGGISIRDLHITGPAGGAVNSAISLQHLTDVEIKNVVIDGTFGVDGIHWFDVEDSWIVECFFNISGNGTVAVNLLSTSNNVDIRDCIFVADGATSMNGVVMAAGLAQVMIEGCDFEGSSSGNVAIQAGGTQNVSIRGNFFENWTGACIAANVATAAAALVIRDNIMSALAAAAADIILTSAGPNDHVTVEDNTFALLGNAGQTAIGILAGTTTNLYIRGNRSTGATSQFLSINGVVQQQTDLITVSGVQITGTGNTRSRFLRPVQSPAFAANLAVDATLGEHVFVSGLTGNITIGAPSNGDIGQELTFNFIQDGTGGRTVTWNPVFIRVAWSDAGNAANARSSIRFVCFDRINWLQCGAQKGWS